MLPIRIVAAVLALLGVLPLWKVLPTRATGLAGSVTAGTADAYAAMLWNGLLVMLIPAVIAALLLDSEKLEAMLRRAAEPLTRARPVVYATMLGLFAFALAAFVATWIMGGTATLIDSFAQLTQARYMAAGRLAGPALSTPEFWLIPQTIITSKGWVSQYPPGYIALLALGFKLNAVALVGPFMLGIAVFFTALIADEVFENRALARVAALLAAVSGFMLGQAGAFMSHVAAAAFSCAALYFVLRGLRGGRGYALAAGACIGALFTIRPLTGVVAGLTALLCVLFDRTMPRTRVARVISAALGAAPFVAVVAAYNTHLFGGPARFGYDAALGPAAGLGFGVDPFGNTYGPIEALAYASAELTALSIHLLEAPLPLVLLVGLFFMIAPPVRAQARLLFWWGISLFIAYLFYWHHGLFMGPRMLADNGTLWVLLAVMSVAGLIARIPHAARLAGRYSARSFTLGAVCAAAFVGVIVLTPARLFSYTPTSEMQELLYAPRASRPALVFVHGGWTGRVAARLAARGMTLDSVETALRQNSTCAAHRLSLGYPHSAVQLDFAPRSTNLPRSVQLSPGNRIRIKDGEPVTPDCVTEMRADQAGAVDVSPYMWQGDLPGLAGNGAMFVRDMGPAANARVIAQYPKREPLMLAEQSGDVRLVPYAQGMRARWGVN